MTNEEQLLDMIERGVVTFENPRQPSTWLDGIWRYQHNDIVVEITTNSYKVFVTRLRQLNLWDEL